MSDRLILLLGGTRPPRDRPPAARRTGRRGSLHGGGPAADPRQPMIDRIWLVRHASTDWSGKRWCGRTDLPLSAEGMAEAEELAIWLAARLPADVVVVSSPARRARDTAEPIERLPHLRTNVGGGRGGVDVGGRVREGHCGRV